MVKSDGKINSLRPRQSERHFADDIFNYISLIENIWIPIKISLKFFPMGPNNKIPALVQIMAWRHPGDKPLSEPMIYSLPTHICVTRPQWVTRQDLMPGSGLLCQQKLNCNSQTSTSKFSTTGVTIIPKSHEVNSMRPGASICITELVDHWFRQWLVTCLASYHYLN